MYEWLDWNAGKKPKAESKVDLRGDKLIDFPYTGGRKMTKEKF